VKVLVRPDDADHAESMLRAAPGVLRVVRGHAGEGARIVPHEGAP
jgi:hypothetical protein